MIRYTLLCPQEHGFESWFRDSDAFDTLAATGQVACPACGSTAVRKALMSPSVVTSRARGKAVPPPATEAVPQRAAEAPEGPRPVALLDERAAQLRAALRELHRKVVENADNVGRSFASEARLIHEGGAPARSIYGEATGEEVSALIEDGIPLMPMPILPDDHH